MQVGLVVLCLLRSCFIICCLLRLANQGGLVVSLYVACFALRLAKQEGLVVHMYPFLVVVVGLVLK